MNMKRFISLLAVLMLMSGISACAASKPPVPVTEKVLDDAVSLFDQHLFDEAEAGFKKVVADSYHIEELVEIRLKSLQYLGFIERERNDYVHSNKWFKAATINLKEFGNDYTGEFACSVLGNLADVGFEENELVVARLRFKANEVNGKIYQDVDAIDIKKLK